MQGQATMTSPPYFQGIPIELQQIPQWILWYNDLVHNERGTKYPRHPRGDYTAAADNPEHWMDFATACKKCKSRKNVSGIGLYLTKDMGMTVIDIDKCVDPNKVVGSFAQSILDKFDNQTYVELSYHEDGLHIVTYGNLPDGEKGAHRSNGIDEIEMYDSGRFIAFTGHKITTTNSHIGHCDDVHAQLCKEFVCVKEKPHSVARNTSSCNNQTICDKLNLQCMNIAAPYKSRVSGDEVIGCNPISGHANTSGTAYSVNTTKNTWHCWAHECGGDALMLYAMEKGFISCGEKISDWAEVFAALRDDGYELDDTYDPHCGDDLMNGTDSEIITGTTIEQQIVAFENIDRENRNIATSLLALPPFPKITHPLFVEYASIGGVLSYSHNPYHYATLLTLLSMGVGKRVCYYMGIKKEYCNIAVYVVGRTTVSGKSYAWDMGEEEFFKKSIMAGNSMNVVDNPYISRDTHSQPGLIKAETNHNNMVWFYDDCGTILDTFNSFNKGMVPRLCSIYDKCHDEYHLHKEDLIVENAYLNLHWNSTQGALTDSSNASFITSGLALRIMWFIEEGGKPRPNKVVEEDTTKRISKLNKFIGDVVSTISSLKNESITFETNDIIEGWFLNRIMENLDSPSDEVDIKRGFVGRARSHAYKIASLMSIYDSTDDTILKLVREGKLTELKRIKIPDVWAKESVSIVNDYLIPRGLYVKKLGMSGSKTNDSSIVMSAIVSAGGHLTRRELLRRTRMLSKQLDSTTNSLIDAGEIIQVIEPTKDFVTGGVKHGRAPTHYYLASPN